jgi:hypothetical protein
MERLRLEDVKIIFKNFRGEKGPYNEAGVRSFSVVVDDPKFAADLIDEGWALKPLKNEEGDIDAYHLPVKVNYVSRQPPRIYKVSMSNKGQFPLDERTVDMLDYLPIDYADVILNPYQWEVRGESGVKAYCQTMYVVIEENELDIKWANLSADPHPSPREYPEEPPF